MRERLGRFRCLASENEDSSVGRIRERSREHEFPALERRGRQTQVIRPELLAPLEVVVDDVVEQDPVHAGSLAYRSSVPPAVGDNRDNSSDDRIGGAMLTRTAARQLTELEPDEHQRLVDLLEHIDGPDDVYTLGYYVGDSPAGSVWRLRYGRVGVFLAVDDEDILVVGLAVRRGDPGWL